MALQLVWGLLPKYAVPRGALPWLSIPQIIEAVLATEPFWGRGTTLERGDGASAETFTALAMVRAIEGPTITQDTVDNTDTDCADRRYVAGYADAGEVTLDLLFSLADYSDIKDDFEDDEPRNYRVVVRDEDGTRATVAFAGVITGTNVTLEADGEVGVSATIKITGSVSVA